MKSNLLNKIKNKILQKAYYNYFGSSDYDKFVIVTRSRTGSNLLVSLLNSHPNVEAQEEKFNRLKNRSSISVWKNIYSKKPKTIKLVGFKIFYYHPLDCNDKRVWDYIKKDPNIRIIHLIRENLLRTVISKRIAEKTNSWSEVNKKNNTNKKIVFNKIEYFKEFEMTKQWIEEFKKEYGHKNIYSITYENLVLKRDKINEVQKFLGVENINLTSKLKKQNPEHLKQLISNYYEMVEIIKNSKWNYLLELDN